jgi:16S rRNA (cytosine967-C5)-methyltransferase
VSPGRQAALRIREQVERGRRLDVALAAEAEGLDPRERGFAHELAYGVTRLRGRLDHLIAPRVHRGLDSLDRATFELLRLGSYQLLYMDGVPRYAAVSQSVEAARALRGKGGAGLVNAVLRKVADAGDGAASFPDPDVNPVGYLSSWGSHPRWLVERWTQRWGAEATRALIEADNARPGIYLVPLGVPPARAVELLAEAGLGSSEVGEGTACVRLEAGVKPAAALAALPDVIVQDPAANLVTRYADLAPGMKVADLCAAPGGKALALSGGAAFTMAADRSERRTQMVRENARRTGRPLGIVVADAGHPPVSGVDAVLLDVPCTGTGTLARHPDSRWRLRPESVVELAAVQRHLLDAAAEAVRPGGLLLYSTCTLEPEENEEQVASFLDRHEDFQIEATDAVPERYMNPVGLLTVRPHPGAFDGAFAARMRRRG